MRKQESPPCTRAGTHKNKNPQTNNMKMNRQPGNYAALLLAAGLVSWAALSDAVAQVKINPATGLPTALPGQLTPEGAVNSESQTAVDLHQLILNRQYEAALQRCLAFHNQWKTSASLISILPDWVELGRRYPRARAALVAIRDGDVREFSQGRGFFALFQEISSINHYLDREDGTYELFNSFRDKDAGLSRQCYIVAQPLLVAHGDYQWCYDHMGDAQTRFDSLRQEFSWRLELQERHKATMEKIRKQIAEVHQQRGFSNMSPPPPDASGILKRSAEDSFIGKTRELIEILVATGHPDQAGKIRDQALRVLDDPRLKSAVDDATDRIGRQSAAGPRQS
jgi:hypothetical protein